MRAMTHERALTSGGMELDLADLSSTDVPWYVWAVLVLPLALAIISAGPFRGRASASARVAVPSLSDPSELAPVPLAIHGPVLPSVVRVDVALFNVNTHEEKLFSIPLDGAVSEAEADELAAFFRCYRTGRKKHMDPGLLAMLADLAQHYEGHTIEVVSGYRHPPHAARTSRHRFGRAIDLRVRGVKAHDVRDYLWTKHTVDVGIGYYIQQQFVHMDHRDGDGTMSWTQRRENSRYQYRPGWATKIRRAQQQQQAVAAN